MQLLVSMTKGDLVKNIKWILVLVLAVACSKNEQLVSTADRENPDQELQAELAERNSIIVRDEGGNPVANAKILIGHEPNVPFQNNIVTTGSNGEVSVPAGWNQELPITISKDGFVRTSYLKQIPEGQIFDIRHRKSSSKHTVKGSATGFGSLPSDGFIDFALSISTLDNQSALNFDITQLISEETDAVNVMGQTLDIPTNVFVPKQKENYSFIPVTIEKAFYRLFYGAYGTYKIQSNRGKFDFKKVADKLKGGKSFFEVVNDFEFLSMGTKNVLVNQSNVALDIDSNQKKLTPKIPFTSPVPTSGMLFGVTMVEEDQRLLPADIKLRENKAQTLAFPESTSKGKILLVYADKVQVKKDEAKLSDSMSTALVDSQKLNDGFLLERVAAPTLTSTGMKLSKPTAKGNLKGYATYAGLSEIKQTKFETFNLERADVSWEIYSPGWIEEIDLPNVNAIRANQNWHVVFYGIDSSSNKEFNGPRTLNQATHAVHNSLQF